MNCAHGFPSEEAHLDGADQLLRVSRGDAARDFRVETHEQAMQVRGTMELGVATEAGAQIFGTGWRVGQSFDKRAEIQAGPCREDGELGASAEIIENDEGRTAIVSGSEDFVRLDEVDEMMPDALLFSRRNFRCADVEMTINLGGIADEDFATEFTGQGNAQGRFSGSGGAENDDQGERGFAIASAEVVWASRMIESRSLTTVRKQRDRVRDDTRVNHLEISPKRTTRMSRMAARSDAPMI